MAADATEQTSTAGTVSTFDTQWPKWAYQIAMAAFLYDKQVQVIADGQPDGDKLLSVNIFLPLHPPHQSPQPALHRPLTSKNRQRVLIRAYLAATSGRGAAS
jgi:hypothetical protein